MTTKPDIVIASDDENGSIEMLAHLMTIGLTLWLPPLVRLVRRAVAR